MISQRLSASLSDDVHGRLVQWLAEQSFAPNTRLPGEHALALQFSVSRPVLRQALARLREEGRLHVQKGSGTFTRTVPIALPDPSFAALVNIPDVRSFLEFRCSLESELAGYAAERRTEQDIAAVEAARLDLDHAMATKGSGIEEDIVLHAAIAQASQNRFFIASLASLAEQTRFSIKLTRELATRPKEDRIREIHSEHERICVAIVEGRPEEAKQAMIAHLRGGIDRLFG